jgi:hypothetical protein
MTAPDIFAFTRPDPTPEQIEIARSRGWFPVGRHENQDAEILALFHEWLDVCRILDETGDHDERDPNNEDTIRWNAACKEQVDVEDRIFECRGGPIGLAVKTFIDVYRDTSNWTPLTAQIRIEEDHDRAGWLTSLLRDAAALVPEIAECAAAIVHEDAALIDAEMTLEWVDAVWRDRDGNTPQWRRDVLSDGQTAIDRIAETPARAPRGEAIKIRYRNTTLYPMPDGTLGRLNRPEQS